jgi:hypothetical protein
MKKIIPVLFFGCFLVLTSCFQERRDQRQNFYRTESNRTYQKTPIDNIITTYIDVSNYSVLLADMNYDESKKKYYHKYKIIIDKSNPSEETKDKDFKVVDTDWKEVSVITFDKYQNDLGMTIISKEDGVLKKNTIPAGYNNYVGNPKYGSWQTNSSGGSFWAFYGKYAFLRSVFGGARYYRNDYDYYRRNTYGRDYYGRNRKYGTSTYKNTNSTWASKPSSFKNKVNQNVKKSASSLKSKGYSSTRSYGSTNKTTRSSGKYNSSSSFRSRSGGFGK